MRTVYHGTIGELADLITLFGLMPGADGFIYVTSSIFLARVAALAAREARCSKMAPVVFFFEITDERWNDFQTDPHAQFFMEFEKVAKLLPTEAKDCAARLEVTLRPNLIFGISVLPSAVLLHHRLVYGTGYLARLVFSNEWSAPFTIPEFNIEKRLGLIK